MRSILNIISDFRSRSAAKEAAKAACQQLAPDEPILGVLIYADESSRYVIRVFCGHRAPAAQPLPPWEYCYVFAVPKNGEPAEQLHDEQYRPTIR